MKLLHFSGGLDSLATLFVLRPLWHELTVLWVDTGAAYFETYHLMRRIANLPIKKFVSVESSQPMFVATHGYPVDILPVWSTSLGNLVRNSHEMKFLSPFACCGENIWAPAAEATKRLNATTVFRGQRAEDVLKAPIQSGHTHDGVEYVFPIEDWSRAQVKAYTGMVCPELIPAYYGEGEVSSRDCMDCTAYLADNVQRIRSLPDPVKKIVLVRLSNLVGKVSTELNVVKELV